MRGVPFARCKADVAFSASSAFKNLNNLSVIVNVSYNAVAVPILYDSSRGNGNILIRAVSAVAIIRIALTSVLC